MGATMRSFFCIILLIIRCLYFFIMRFFDYLYIDNQKLWQVLRITEYGLMIYWDSFQKAYFLTFPLRQLSITILKVLHGRKMFYLLLYGILENDRLSQRTLEDIFNDSVFKILFGLETDESLSQFPFGAVIEDPCGLFPSDLRLCLWSILGVLFQFGDGTIQPYPGR